MLAVQECNVQHLLRVVSSMVTQGLMLKVAVLNVAFLLELFDVDLSLSDCCPPAVVGQLNLVAESLDTPLKRLKVDVLNAQAFLKRLYELLDLAWNKTICIGSQVLSCLAKITPTIGNEMSGSECVPLTS